VIGGRQSGRGLSPSPSSSVFCYQCHPTAAAGPFIPSSLTVCNLWTFGTPLWGTASNSNIEILQRYQNKFLRAKVNASRYISNKVLHTDFRVPTIREEITKFSVKCRDKITTHPNELASTLLEEEEPRRLKRFKPTDSTTRFSSISFHRYVNIRFGEYSLGYYSARHVLNSVGF
jgi:hypothetical protein